MAQSFFHDGEHVLVTPALCLDETLRHQASLSQSGREEIPPLMRPDYGSACLRSTRCNSRYEQDGGGIVAEVRTCSGNVVQSAIGEAAPGQPFIHGRNTERQRLLAQSTAKAFERPHFLAQRLYLQQLVVIR